MAIHTRFGARTTYSSSNSTTAKTNDAYFQQMEDIDMLGVGYRPIASFKGHLTGQDIISNLTPLIGTLEGGSGDPGRYAVGLCSGPMEMSGMSAWSIRKLCFPTVSQRMRGKYKPVIFGRNCGHDKRPGGKLYGDRRFNYRGDRKRC